MSSSPANPNVAMLLKAAEKLRPLLDEIVFVGGCTTGLLVSDPAAAPIRATLDVDAIVEVSSYAEYLGVAERLRALGFHESRDIICRWTSHDTVLDLMPTDKTILGFSNRWYHPAMANAQQMRFDGFTIRVVTAPYFLACKLEAFHGRGKNDYRGSRDLEDVVALIDGRQEIVEEVLQAPPDLRQYLGAEFRSLLLIDEFRNALPGHLLPDSASQQRLGLVVKRMKLLAGER
jgi:predicted nucleotidyltransferase